MKEYLVGIGYHSSYLYRKYKEGIIEDYEGSTAIFITANAESQAISWGAIVAKKLFEIENPNETIAWENLYDTWIEKDIQKSGWIESIDFFQKVKYGEYPNFEKMGSESYKEWLRINNPDWYNKHIKD